MATQDHYEREIIKLYDAFGKKPNENQYGTWWNEGSIEAIDNSVISKAVKRAIHQCESFPSFAKFKIYIDAESNNEPCIDTSKLTSCSYCWKGLITFKDNKGEYVFACTCDSGKHWNKYRGTKSITDEPLISTWINRSLLLTGNHLLKGTYSARRNDFYRICSSDSEDYVDFANNLNGYSIPRTKSNSKSSSLVDTLANKMSING